MQCPCHSQLLYSACCQPWHQQLNAPNAQSLMRSRYSAYVLEQESYLLETWHPKTRPTHITFTAGITWIGLAVKRYIPMDNTHAIVEFVAKYQLNDKIVRLHEESRFVFENNRWYYVDGHRPK